MKVQIRYGVFETNSSSVHTLTMCDKSDFEKWKNNEMKFCGDKQSFLPNKEADEKNKEIFEYYGNVNIFTLSPYIASMYYLTFDEFMQKIVPLFEYFEYHYKGIVSFGYFGDDHDF